MVHDVKNDPLSLWRDGAARRAILDFVEDVTGKDSSSYVAPEGRIAVFDNDGTLWCEKPMPVEVGFILERLASMAEKDPALRERQPWQAAYTRDYHWLGDVITKHYQGDDSDVKLLLRGILHAFNGMDVEEYQASASVFLHSERNPHLKRPYLATAYAPMQELLRYLEAHGFTNYIASGGDRDFMRAVTQSLYGIPSERVIGSSNGLGYQPDAQGGSIVYQEKPDVFDDGPIKPVRIWSRIGRRPILAGGNSNGDIPMLSFARTQGRPALRLLLLHDDPEREFDYVSGAEQALEQAQEQGWTVVSIKHDWKQVFQEEIT